jgi:hypothetical protein
VVEAEPDCKVAMDILGFALYHENNGDVAGTMSKVSDAEDNSGDESFYGDDDISSKRRRIDDASSKSNAIKAQIWEEIVSHEGELALGETCGNIEDRDRVIEAVDEMVQEGNGERWNCLHDRLNSYLQGAMTCRLNRHVQSGYLFHDSIHCNNEPIVYCYTFYVLLVPAMLFCSVCEV